MCVYLCSFNRALQEKLVPEDRGVQRYVASNHQQEVSSYASGLTLEFLSLQGPRGGRGARGPTGKPGPKVPLLPCWSYAFTIR